MAFSLKLAGVSATVFSTALLFKLLTLSDFPAMWTSLISWLEPPYLYLLINCIIITIVASSRLHSASPPVLEPLKFVLPLDAPQIHEPVVEESTMEVHFAGAGAKFVQVSEPEFTEDVRDIEAYVEMTKDKPWTPSKIDLSFPKEKPPASARFTHRRPTSQGGRTLGVSKPKKQDTLETTWKTITEGRSVPLTRHLRKSDTWETHGHNRSSDNSMDHQSKSDTFEVDRSRKPPAPPSKLNRSGGSGKLRKEPSLGQEELNRKVEAFIKKFNEDMRLQRQESLNQFMEMINRGAH